MSTSYEGTIGETIDYCLEKTEQNKHFETDLNHITSYLYKIVAKHLSLNHFGVPQKN